MSKHGVFVQEEATALTAPITGRRTRGKYNRIFTCGLITNHITNTGCRNSR